jgi:hypothetical protein
LVFLVGGLSNHVSTVQASIAMADRRGIQHLDG